MRACERRDGVRLVRDTDVCIGTVFVLYIDAFVSFFCAQSHERVL